MKTRLTLTIWLLSAVIFCFSLFDRFFAKHEFRQRNRFAHSGSRRSEAALLKRWTRSRSDPATWIYGNFTNVEADHPNHGDSCPTHLYLA